MNKDIYRNYLLTVLMVILAFNYTDRSALGLLLQDIKMALNLSDTQLGLLTGIAFSLFYSVMAIPIGLWVDRGNRVTVIALTTALWSVAVAVCGLVKSFPQLLLVRIGVAVGEAGCLPPANSLIPDYFARAERPRAVARYMLGGPLSVLVGFFGAGWLNQLYGWRTTFMLLGIPGVLLAALVKATLVEPRSAVGANAKQIDDPTKPGLAEVCGTLWRIRTFRHLLICFSITCLFSYGIAQWQPAFFIRSYGMRTGELGTWLAVIYGGIGILGMYAGGEIATRFAANREQVQLRVMAAVLAGFGVISCFIYLSRTPYIAFGLIAIATAGTAAISGPLFATLQTLIPERMRATSIALLYLFANLVGMGLGPLMVGTLSDLLRPSLGEQSLRYALLAICPGHLWGAWYYWQASKTVEADMTAKSGALGTTTGLLASGGAGR